jgi:DNA-binding SARP family transcriptional activator
VGFGVLGPLTVHHERIRREPTAPKQRQLLALLLLNANQVISVQECIKELWGHNPSNNAIATLHTYVMQLRKAFAGESRRGGVSVGNLLLTKDRGYLFALRPGDLDLHVFEERVEQARRALDKNDDEMAADMFRRALALWRGRPLVDVQRGVLLHSRVAGLEEFQLNVLEQRIEADLRLGRHHELLSELSMLVERHPLHENLHAQLMLALYRSGRPAHALEVFRRLRRMLKEELGLEPLPRMQQLQTAVLRSDPALDAPADVRSRLSLDILGPSYAGARWPVQRSTA